MAYRDLREFIIALEKMGQLKRVQVPVDPELEIAEVADRTAKTGGPALLFEQVQGSDIPVLINLLGTEERVCLALGVHSLNDLSKRLEEILTTEPPHGTWEKLKVLWQLKGLAGYLPSLTKQAPCQEVVHREDSTLATLPALKCWPGDAGRFITLPHVFTKDPETGRQNCGIYRMQIYDPKTAGMHWHLPKDGSRHFGKYRELGVPMPVAVAIGVDPAITFAAALPLPEGLDEMMVAGFLRGQGVKMVKGQTVDVAVPALSEIVLEGYLEPTETKVEGPFGDHTGYYTEPAPYPVFHLTCITHRKGPFYQAMVVGRPPQEDCFLGRAIERFSLPIIKLQLPEIKDIHMPFEGAFHNLVIVSLEKRYPGHARKVMHGLWGMSQLAFTKVIVVVDGEEDVRDISRLAFEVLNNIDPQRDLEFVMGPVDTLDHASRFPMYGSKVGIDATRKWPEEGFSRPWPSKSKMADQVVEKVTRRWKEYGL